MFLRLGLVMGLGLLAPPMALAEDSPGELFPATAGGTSHVVPAVAPRQDLPRAAATLTPEPAASSSPGATASQPSPVKKTPVPTGAPLQAATKLVLDTYKDALSKAGSAARQVELARNLLQTGLETTADTAACFALFSKAKDLAVQGGDLGVAFGVIDEIDRGYQVDALRMRADAAVAVADAARNAEQRAAMVPKMLGIVDLAVAVDRYDIARWMAATAQTSARLANEPDLQTAAASKAQQVSLAESAYVVVKPALVTLAAKPTDPDANCKVGKFFCLIKGDWERGLPMLAIGSDAGLKALAARESEGATDADGQVALGDAWWAAAEKETGASKLQCQKRGGKWYSQAVEALAGLTKLRVEGRLKSMASVEPVLRGVNLLKLIDLKKDVVSGRWEFRNGALACDGEGSYARVEFMYEPPAEYDYKVVFTISAGDDKCIVQHCCAGGHQFLLGWWGANYGFEMIDGKGASSNQTRKSSNAWFVNGQQYTSLVKVRKDRVQGYLDGKLITEWKTDYSEMSVFESWRLPRTNTLGLGCTSTPVVFQSAEIVAITGRGKPLK